MSVVLTVYEFGIVSMYRAYFKYTIIITQIIDSEAVRLDYIYIFLRTIPNMYAAIICTCISHMENI